jgi:hypothetical protein
MLEEANKAKQSKAKSARLWRIVLHSLTRKSFWRRVMTTKEGGIPQRKVPADHNNNNKYFSLDHTQSVERN